MLILQQNFFPEIRSGEENFHFWNYASNFVFLEPYKKNNELFFENK
jgi:hypothetical protein